MGLWDGYDFGAGYDEMFESPGVPRPHTRRLVEALDLMSAGDLADRQRRASLAFMELGITFTVYSEGSGVERIFPFDLVPRIIDAGEWRHIEAGLKQRVLALNHFIQDVYNDQRIVAEGVVPAEAVFCSPNFQPAVRGFTPPGGVWVHIAGIDLVRDAAGTVHVLEDNVRTPSGVSYVMQNRAISTRTFPRLFSDAGVRRVADYCNRLHAVCGAGCPRARRGADARRLQLGLFRAHVPGQADGRSTRGGARCCHRRRATGDEDDPRPRPHRHNLPACG
jgi:uncharacterized circularly permuted ATP-grasp superfamily protein